MRDLDDLILTLQVLQSKDVEAKIAEKAVPFLRAALLKTLTAGQSADDGSPWEPKKDGGRAYANVASKLTVTSAGSKVRATITGPEAFGQYGGGKRMPVRTLLPDIGANVPKSVTDAILQSARLVLKGLFS